MNRKKKKKTVKERQADEGRGSVVPPQPSRKKKVPATTGRKKKKRKALLEADTYSCNGFNTASARHPHPRPDERRHITDKRKKKSKEIYILLR
jgi:hypothetical protein